MIVLNTMLSGMDGAKKGLRELAGEFDGFFCSIGVNGVTCSGTLVFVLVT